MHRRYTFQHLPLDTLLHARLHALDLLLLQLQSLLLSLDQARHFGLRQLALEVSI